MEEMKFRRFIVDYIDIPANPEQGFNFPFKIIIPKNLNDNPDLIYACNLPKNYSEECSSFDELMDKAKDDTSSIDAMMIHLSLERGNPIIIPAVPRLNEFRPNYLGRDCYLNDFDRLKGSKFGDYMYKYENLADQHKSMMIYAAKYLNSIDINVDNKVIICGYSEGAKMASRLALLHPEMIKAVVAGGTGGAISMPIDFIDGYEFVYPTGISDLKDFDFDSFKSISFFYYMGDNDKSDSVIPKFEPYHYKNELGEDCILKDESGNETVYVDDEGKQHFLLDKNGNYMATYSMYSDQEVNAINKVLGTITQKRFKKQQEIYSGFGLNAIFKLYPGNHKTVFDNKEEIFADVDNFISRNLRKETQRVK